jgi:hypothetical protein
LHVEEGTARGDQRDDGRDRTQKRGLKVRVKGVCKMVGPKPGEASPRAGWKGLDCVADFERDDRDGRRKLLGDGDWVGGRVLGEELLEGAVVERGDRVITGESATGERESSFAHEGPCAMDGVADVVAEVEGGKDGPHTSTLSE